MPYAQRKMAHVILIPIKDASRFPISGNMVILQRKYTAIDMIEPDVMRSAI